MSQKLTLWKKRLVVGVLIFWTYRCTVQPRKCVIANKYVFWSKFTHGSVKRDIHMRLSSNLHRLHGWAYILETYVKTSTLIQSNVWIISDQRAIQFYRCLLHINHQQICPKKTNPLKLNLHASWAILMMCQIFLGMSTTSLTFTAKISVVPSMWWDKASEGRSCV